MRSRDLFVAGFVTVVLLIGLRLFASVGGEDRVPKGAGAIQQQAAPLKPFEEENIIEREEKKQRMQEEMKARMEKQYAAMKDRYGGKPWPDSLPPRAEFAAMLNISEAQVPPPEVIRKLIENNGGLKPVIKNGVVVSSIPLHSESPADGAGGDGASDTPIAMAKALGVPPNMVWQEIARRRLILAAQTKTITSVEDQFSVGKDAVSGTEYKVLITFSDGTKAVFKPDSRVFGKPDTRENGALNEVAAYHVDRLLGFGRVAPSLAVRLSNKIFSDTFHERALHRDPSEEFTVAGPLIYYVDDLVSFHFEDCFEVRGRSFFPDGIKEDCPPCIAGEFMEIMLYDYITAQRDGKRLWGTHTYHGADLPGYAPVLLVDNTNTFEYDTLAALPPPVNSSVLGKQPFAQLLARQGLNPHTLDHDPHGRVVAKECKFKTSSVFALLNYVDMTTGECGLAAAVEAAVSADSACCSTGVFAGEPLPAILSERQKSILNARILVSLKLIDGCKTMFGDDKVFIADNFGADFSKIREEDNAAEDKVAEFEEKAIDPDAHRAFFNNN